MFEGALFCITTYLTGKKCKHPKMNTCRKCQRNRIMGKCSKIGGMVLGKRGGISKKKCKRHKCHPKMNLYRKSHPNRTTFKNMGEMVFGKRERIWGSGNLKKKCKLHKCHPKMIICRKFHPNQTMGKCYKIRGKF